MVAIGVVNLDNSPSPIVAPTKENRVANFCLAKLTSYAARIESTSHAGKYRVVK